MTNVEEVKASPLYQELAARKGQFDTAVDEHWHRTPHNRRRDDALVEMERDHPNLVIPGVLLGNLVKAAQRLDVLSAERVRPGEEELQAQRVDDAKAKFAEIKVAAQQHLDTTPRKRSTS
jgi:hypothetical protein